MRVLVLTGNYFKDNLNLGDLAIYASLYGMLPGRATVTFVSGAPHAVQQIGDRVRCVSPPPPATALKHTYWQALVERADLVFASGGSYFSALFKTQAEDVLDGLAAAQRAGRPTAVAGAAFEPLDDEGLSRKAHSVLNDVTTLWTRDLASARVLAGLGIPWTRISCHADPALRACLAVPGREPGNVLGINLRDSSFYNPVTEEFREALRQGVSAFLAETGPELRGLPVSLHGPSDEQAVLRTWPQATRPRTTTPEELLTHLADCRLVVCGSHHAAVFALGLGVPVLMVGASTHYMRKLRSLEPFFGDAARAVDLASPQASEEIRIALGQLWQIPSAQRARLRRVARWHVEKGQDLIDRFVAGHGPITART